MKSLLKLLCAAAFVVGISSEANTGTKVEVHHNGMIISVSINALDAHLEHGDTEHTDDDDCPGCDCGDCDPV